MLSDFATPLAVALVPYAPLLDAVHRALQIISWQSSWYDAWLVIAAWWALCLLSRPYLLPFLVVLVLSIPPRPPPLPTTEKNIETMLANLTAMNALLPAWPKLPPLTVLRVAGIAYVPYIVITHIVPIRIVFALVGTVVLIARAPFTSVIISTLSRSAYLRHTFRYTVSLLTGTPIPPTILSNQPSSTDPTPVPALRFLFTIYENQRWWMGLDWTAALLPNERPSWCSPPPTHAPVSPPNVFTLPSATTVYLPGKNGSRIKRTAIWRWEEPEWRVVVRREGGAMSRVERPIPEDNSDAATETTGSRLLKAAGKMRDSGVMGTNSTAPPSNPDPATEDVHEGYPDEDHIATDSDGWIYGDNKWESTSSKNNIGKFTRYRRWTRVAIVSESIQIVDQDDPVVVKAPDSPSPPQASTETQDSKLPMPGDEILAHGKMTESPPEAESPLRQRLRRALSKPSH
ncbi:hypothetical protein H0H92_008518 [Tricholoma furcatifolium]|nr:hypothetical protein H0H92_008518 [Tricholoma furcatifolium]